jgi:SAM-dependent methyltransferase
MTMTTTALRDQILSFWEDRARLGETAGTNDFMLKKLELGETLARVPPGSSVLDVGCGTGTALIELAEQKACTGLGIDYSPKTIDVAKASLEGRNIDDRVTFQAGEIPGLDVGGRRFDVVISGRCLINLTSKEEQRAAFDEMRSLIAPGGLLLMFENSLQGLANTNAARDRLGLEPMTHAWHNIYFDEDELQSWQDETFTLEELVHFSSTYFFLSRVVYAKLAKDTGQELLYDSPINLLSLSLPNVGQFGATKLWIWRKKR